MKHIHINKSRFVFTLLLLCSISFAAGQTYFSRTGKTYFEASTASFEPVRAINESTSVILKTNSGDIASQLFIGAFNFKVALMQEHFNENYMDTDKFPKAKFAGKIIDFITENLETEKEFKLKGVLTIKGIEKEIETTAKIQKVGEKLLFKSKLKLSPGDFNIKIPSIVRKKIAEFVNVDINYELNEKK